MGDRTEATGDCRNCFCVDKRRQDIKNFESLSFERKASFAPLWTNYDNREMTRKSRNHLHSADKRRSLLNWKDVRKWCEQKVMLCFSKSFEIASKSKRNEKEAFSDNVEGGRQDAQTIVCILQKWQTKWSGSVGNRDQAEPKGKKREGKRKKEKVKFRMVDQ